MNLFSHVPHGRSWVDDSLRTLVEYPDGNYVPPPPRKPPAPVKPRPPKKGRK